MFNISFAMVVSAAIIAAFAAILAVYLWAEARNNGKNGFERATGLKLTLSGLFCVAGIFSYGMLYMVGSVTMPPQFFILLGLFAGLAGDFFLQYIRLDTKKYIAGILCFSATQVLFITYLFITGIPDVLGSVLTGVITAAVLVLVLVLMKKQSWKLGREQAALTIYTVLLSFMTARAIVNLLWQPSLSSGLFALGAVLFLVSDFLLGIWNYNTSKRAHANLNWITYFAGMLLIALSIMPMPL